LDIIAEQPKINHWRLWNLIILIKHIRILISRLLFIITIPTDSAFALPTIPMLWMQSLLLFSHFVFVSVDLLFLRFQNFIHVWIIGFWHFVKQKFANFSINKFG
jgi:hypothetical protein